MQKTDAKIRLFLELSHPHPIQILDYIPLQSDDLWNPEMMYENPKTQLYYAFINDKELTSRLLFLFDPEYNYDINNISEEVNKIKEELKDSRISIEFNGCNIEEYDELEKNKLKINNPILNENMEDNIIENNININVEEERYVVFCRFFLKNFGFIHNFEKLNRDDVIKIKEKPIIYALKGRIKTLLNLRNKEFEVKKSDNDIVNIGINEDDKNNQNEILNKKELDDKNKLINKAIDGHWFLVNSFEDIDFLSIIKYKEKLTIQSDQDKINSNIIAQNNNTQTIQNKIISQKQTKYMNPHFFSFNIKDSKKFVTVYQKKSCKEHHNKNEFICKDCNDFCCLECFEEKSKNNNHYGHKISLLDETMKKFEEDMEFMKERIKYLKGIIENEINDKKIEINSIKGKN